MKKTDRNVDFRINDHKSARSNLVFFWEKVLYFLLAFIIIGSFTIIVIQQGQIKDLKKQNIMFKKSIEESEKQENVLKNQLSVEKETNKRLKKENSFLKGRINELTSEPKL